MVKTYRSDDMMGALQAVMQDLGPDAIILSMRNVATGPGWKVWSKPYCEVLAAPAGSSEAAASANRPQLEQTGAYEDGVVVETSTATVRAAAPAVKAAPEAAAALPKSGPQIVPFRPELIITRAIENPRPAVENQPAAQTPEPAVCPVAHYEQSEEAAGWPKGLELMERQLILQGLDRTLIRRVLTAAKQSLNPGAYSDPERVQAFVARQLELALPQPAREDLLSQQRVVFLVGPSGGGKTSVCAKIAARCKLELDKKVSWVCLDTLHTGAMDEARAYASTLGIDLFIVYNSEDFQAAIESTRGSDIVLVDTPGLNPRNRAQIVEITTYLSQMPQRSTLLVAPATAKETDLEQAYYVAKPFGVAGLILTKMDETYTFGSVFNLIWRNKLPLLFTTNGTNVVTNLHLARRSELAEALLDEVIL